MTQDIKDFLKEIGKTPTSRKRSVLANYEEEILELKKLGYTESIILMFLEQKKGIKVAQSTLNWFINSRFKKTSLQNNDSQLGTNQRTSLEKAKSNLETSIHQIAQSKAEEDNEVARRPSWASKKPLSELI